MSKHMKNTTIQWWREPSGQLPYTLPATHRAGISFSASLLEES